MNSFMLWGGGKKSLRDAVLARFPPYYERYIEVFEWIAGMHRCGILPRFRDYDRAAKFYQLIRYSYARQQHLLLRRNCRGIKKNIEKESGFESSSKH